jgi:hypothetical protein
MSHRAQATMVNFASYRSGTLCQYLVSLHSQNTSQSLAKLQAFTSHLVFVVDQEAVYNPQLCCDYSELQQKLLELSSV